MTEQIEILASELGIKTIDEHPATQPNVCNKSYRGDNRSQALERSTT
jgi:hypothetical protein